MERTNAALELGEGELCVTLNRKQYVAGDLLHGKVFLRLPKRVHSSEFVVRLEGREHISWLEQPRSSGTSGSTPRRRHNKDILQENVRSCRSTMKTFYRTSYSN